jgi:oxalate decarboxylase/phosphoglucose isomerase-like protein (cupin superfamily)
MGPTEHDLSFQAEVTDGWSVQVPAGTWHDIINTGSQDMRLYVVYAPVHHTAGILQQTAADAEQDEESGRDTPPEWSVQPPGTVPDAKA